MFIGQFHFKRRRFFYFLSWCAMKGRVLIVAGSDSGGGAGIQADIKTVAALGGFAMTAITALTAQNTQGVSGVYPTPPDFVAAQMRAVLSDLGADALKTGMLVDAPTIAAVADVLEEMKISASLVLDPVMVAKGGHALLDPAAVATLKSRLIPKATLLTPNLPEAEALSGLKLNSEADLEPCLAKLAELGAKSVLLKGGHMEGEMVIDLLWHEGRIERFAAPRINTRNTHGTGCTLASAIACGLAQGMGLVPAIKRAREYLRQAIETAPGYGSGHGPLNHGHNVSA
jgi:hydroxymethylpyrimidine/phosphomethylpyrimidine kinase